MATSTSAPRSAWPLSGGRWDLSKARGIWAGACFGRLQLGGRPLWSRKPSPRGQGGGMTVGAELLGHLVGCCQGTSTKASFSKLHILSMLLIPSERDFLSHLDGNPVFWGTQWKARDSKRRCVLLFCAVSVGHELPFVFREE